MTLAKPRLQDRVKHPVVALTHPDTNGLVQVAKISHKHVISNTAPATDYGLPPNVKDGRVHEIALVPNTILYTHLSKLSAAHPLNGISVADEHLSNLQQHTGILSLSTEFSS